MTRSPQLAAALEYASRGWHVFPLKPGEKHPATQRGHLDASPDPARIEAWWAQNPNYNVGIAVAPSKLVVLDVDVGTNKDGSQKRGRESLAAIEAELSPTLLAQTGRGGTHAVYARPDDVPPARIIGFRDGLDLIGDGYIVAAPSYLSESQKFYQWTQLQAIAPLPPFLATVSRTPRVVAAVAVTGTPIPEGGRNNAMFRLGCALRETGIGAEALARALDAENKQRFNPPLPDGELAVLVNSILTRVEVTRDVALGAVVSQEIQQMFAPPSRSEWLETVSLQPQPPMIFYSTGFASLDALLSGGLATRQLAGIIGPPSAGKSGLVGELLLKLATQRPVLHVSLELPRHELFVRYAAHQMEFPWVDGVKGLVSQSSMSASIRGIRIKLMGSEDIDRNDPFGCIVAEALKIKDECGIAPIIAIDYIQLMARGAGSETRFKVGELTMHARQVAQDLDTVVLGVFTTMRASYGNKGAEDKMRAANDPTAYLAAAKESGDIEFDCATLMYFDVDKICEGATKPARIAVARVRVGSIGFVGVRARLDIGKFWDDPSALGEFASEERAARRDEQSMDTAKQLLLEAVREMPGRPWRDIQARVSSNRGVNRALADRARDAMIGDGVLEKTTRYDQHHRKIPGEALRVISPPNNSEHPEAS